MRRPEISDIRSYCRERVWEEVFSQTHETRINLKQALTQHLVRSGVIPILAEEFAERQLAYASSDLAAACAEWESLGVPPPLWQADQSGLLITWKHPKFEEITDREPLSSNFPDFWKAIRFSLPTELLFHIAGYLYTLDCDNIFITDKSGDGGIDVIGLKNSGPFRGICFVVQCKWAATGVGRDSFLCDFSKNLLSERTGRWKTYVNEIGLNKAIDGFSKCYLFASNNEFADSIRDAARELSVVLRSGRQIAHSLASRFTLSEFNSIRSRIPAIEGSTKLDYRNIFEGTV